jgi:hypothetical protein
MSPQLPRPPARSPGEAFPAVAAVLAELKSLESALLHAGHQSTTGTAAKLYELDFFVMGVINRSLSTISAIRLLVGEWNAAAAIALVRVHLDTLVRLSYVADEPNGWDVGEAVFRGASFRDLSDATGKQKLTDRFLVNRLSNRLPWVRTVYDATNAFVHLSGRHIFSAIHEVGSDEDRTVSSWISAQSPHWSEEDCLELVEATLDMTREILGYLNGWAEWKQRPADPAEGDAGE